MKVRIDTKLSFEDGIKTYSVNGILVDKLLKYKEEDTIVVIDFSNNKMIREDADKRIEYKFDKNSETLNDLFIKDSGYQIKIPIVTENYRCEGSNCFIQYKLLLEDKVITYEVSWEEI